MPTGAGSHAEVRATAQREVHTGARAARPRATEDDATDRVETEMLVLARALEGHARRTDLYRDLDRASYLLARTLDTAGPLSINALAAALGLDATTVTRQITTMEASGLVQRAPAAGDRRVRVVALTPAGRRAMQTLRRARRARIEHVLDGWSAPDRAELGRLLERLNDAIADAR